MGSLCEVRVDGRGPALKWVWVVDWGQEGEAYYKPLLGTRLKGAKGAGW